jgi:protein-S-isoprenylcysteine O-methyltransferase Ste14
VTSRELVRQGARVDARDPRRLVEGVARSRAAVAGDALVDVVTFLGALVAGVAVMFGAVEVQGTRWASVVYVIALVGGIALLEWRRAR